MKEDECNLLTCKSYILTDALLHCSFGGRACRGVYAGIVLLSFLLTYHLLLTACRLGRKNGKSSLSPFLSNFKSSFIRFCSFSCTLVNSQGWEKPTFLPITDCAVLERWTVEKSFRSKFKVTFSSLLYQQ